MKESQILPLCEELDITPNQLLLEEQPGGELEQAVAELTEPQQQALLAFIKTL